MYNLCNVVMLPTNEKAIIGDLALSHNNVLNFAKNEDWLVIYNPIKQHLYITSNEGIKSGDVVLVKTKLKNIIGRYEIDYNKLDNIYQIAINNEIIPFDLKPVKIIS